jgi:hypothetical protein
MISAFSSATHAGLRSIGFAFMLFAAGVAASHAQQTSSDDNDLSAPEAIALGILAVGAGILASEIDKDFFTEAPAPDAGTNGDGPTVIVDKLTVRSIRSTIGIGGDEVFLLASSGQRIPADPSNARDIDAGEEWTPRGRISAAGRLVIELREWDSFNASDVIDRFTVDSGQEPGRHTARLEGDGAIYEISYNLSIGDVPQPRRPAQRNWGIHDSNGKISVADCSRDCGQTINFLMVCEANGQSATVNMPSAGTQNGPTGSIRPLRLSIDGQSFDYQARLSRAGVFGHVPGFRLDPGDPVIEALQAGSRVQVEFDGQRRSFSLRGSRKALDSFKAQCGWTDASTQQVSSRGPVPFWYANQYMDDRTGQMVSSLTFGVPETDAAAIHARCASDGMITLDVTGGTNGPVGSPVALRIGIGNRSQDYDGQVFFDSSEWSGVRVRMTVQDPVWRAMQTAADISFALSNGQQKSLPGQGAGPAVARFLSACGG